MTDETPSEPTPAPPMPQAEAPTEAAPVIADTASEPSTAGFAPPPPNAPADAAAPPHRSSHFLVPKWLGLVVGGLLLAALGFGIGWAVAPDHHGGDRWSDRGSGMPQGRTPGAGLPFGGQGMPGIGGRGSGGMIAPRRTGAYLGVATQAPTGGSGAQIARVSSGSPADGAGLKVDDVVTKVDDTTIASPSDLVQAVTSHKVGDEVTITYTRGGNSATVKVKLADRSTISTQ